MRDIFGYGSRDQMGSMGILPWGARIVLAAISTLSVYSVKHQQLAASGGRLHKGIENGG
jgi:hypothetical protein